MFRNLFVLAATTLAGCAVTPDRSVLAGLPHAAFPAPQRVVSGAITAADVSTLQRAGIREVISLRMPDETPAFDEAAALRAAGIAFHDLPIAGADGLTRANVDQFDKLLRDAGNQPTLVHCASGNRVGAMVALRAALIEYQSVAAAIEEGRRWGLQGLEPAVRHRMHEWGIDGATTP